MQIHGTFEEGRWAFEGDAPPGTAFVVVQTSDGEIVFAELDDGRWHVRLAPVRKRRLAGFRKPYNAEARAVRADRTIIAIERDLTLEGNPGRSLRDRVRSLTRRTARGVVVYGPGDRR
jgi:hypothetical protein